MSQSVPVTPELPAQPTTPAPIQPPVLELAAPVTLESPKAYRKRCKAVAREVKAFVKDNPSMRLLLDGKKYAYAPVWQFCAACFGVTPMVTKTEELLTDDRLEMGFLSIAHAIDRNGRVVSGAEATCMCSEADWAGKPSFQLRSMAETRSCSKVLSNLFRYVMVMAGICPTPAEEMGPAPRNQEKQFKTQCARNGCSNMISDKRRNDTRRKYGVALCVPCEKAHHQAEGEKSIAPINDPKFVEQSVAQVRERKGAQPIVAIAEQDREEYA